jgi:ribA/ribD-fused uncharacterized protein
MPISGMYHDRTAVEDAFHAKASLNFLFFWGHQPSKDGKITSSCLSQWWPSQFEVEGTVYLTAEHWMMSQKARLFGDDETALRVLSAQSPKEVKQLGREAKGFDATIWDDNKLAIVEEGSFHKFEQNQELLNYLTSTGDLVLVEASPVDRIWGIGLAADDADATHPPRWRGDNLLGFALMRVRQRLLR